MTDNEIIKALEWHSNDEIHCFACPYEEHSVTRYCVDMVMKDALDLINRQKAKILLFRKENTTLALNNSLKEKKIEEISEVLSDTIRIRYAEAKAEAVKEFAERFNTALSEFDLSSVGLPDYDRGYEDCITAVKDTFDNIVKEMEGED